MKPNEQAELYLLALIQKPDCCPKCGHDEVAAEFFPSDNERHDPPLMHLVCKCDNSNCQETWIEVYQFVAVKIGDAYGPRHGEAWVKRKETIFVSQVNMELLAACTKSLELLKAGATPDEADEHINYLKELIDKAKGE